MVEAGLTETEIDLGGISTLVCSRVSDGRPANEKYIQLSFDQSTFKSANSGVDK